MILGFSFDETTKASCKKIVKVNRRHLIEDEKSLLMLQKNGKQLISIWKTIPGERKMDQLQELMKLVNLPMLMMQNYLFGSTVFTPIPTEKDMI